MKILQINSVYKEGSTGKIVFDLSEVLRGTGHEVLTCYGLGEQKVDSYSQKICTTVEHVFNAFWGRVSGTPFGGVYWSNKRIMDIVRVFKPDIVHVHCINGYMVNVYRLFASLAEAHIKTVLTLHAEIFYTAGCSHAYECEKWKTCCLKCEDYKRRIGSWLFDRSKTSWKMMYDAINCFDAKDIIITAVSPWLAKRARESAIMRHYCVESVVNGLDTSIFHYREASGLIERCQYDKVLLFVTPYFGLENDNNKGGHFLITISKALPNYKFIVVSSKMSNNVHNLPSNVKLWGRAKSQDELAQLYAEADYTLLLSCRETFSMVTAESLCCGTPVFGFKAGGPESIVNKEYAVFVEYGDIHSLINSIINSSDVLYRPSEIASESIKQFNSSQMGENYIQLYDSLLKKELHSQ